MKIQLKKDSGKQFILKTMVSGFCVIVLLSVILSFLWACQGKKSVERQDFRAYLSRHDIIYQQAPLGPFDGSPIGNRRMAGMVYSESGDYKIILSKDDLWDHRTLDYDLTRHGLTHSEVLKKLSDGRSDELSVIPRNRFGEFWGDRPRGKVPGWMPYPAPKIAARIVVGTSGSEFMEQRLSLAEASVHTQYDDQQLNAWIPAGENVFILELEPRIQKDFRVEIQRFTDPELGTSPEFSIADGQLRLKYVFPDGFFYAMAFRLLGAEPQISQDSESAVMEFSGEKQVKLIASVATSLEYSNPVEEADRLVEEFNYSTSKKEHTQKWKEFWNRSHIQLEDKFMENLWYFGLYQAGASFSPEYSGGLAGPYFITEPSPWQNDLHEVNEALKFYGVFAANHPELARGYIESYWRMIPLVRENTRRFYGFDGVRFPHATAYSGEEREAQLSAFKLQYMQCGPGLVSNVAWWYYLYTRDRDMLQKRIYPIIKGAAEFYVNYVTKGEDNLYHVYPTFSPEQAHSVWCSDATIDLATVRDCLTAAIEASKVLGKDGDECVVWQQILENLAEYPRDEKGILEFPGDKRDYLYGHDAVANCIHPMNQYDPSDPVYRDLIIQTQSRLGLNDGASFAKFHLATCAAWMDMGQLAWDLLYDAGIAQYLKVNGFFTERSVINMKNSIGTNLGEKGLSFLFQDPGMTLLATLNEMLMQSHRGTIRVFPAVPAGFTGGFEGLRARDGHLVSAVRDKAGTKWVQVEAGNPGQVKITNPWPGREVRILLDGRSAGLEVKKGMVELEMKTGQKLLMLPKGEKLNLMKWPATQAEGPRKMVWTVKEKLPAGRRDQPIGPPSKIAEELELWLGRPK